MPTTRPLPPSRGLTSAADAVAHAAAWLRWSGFEDAYPVLTRPGSQTAVDIAGRAVAAMVVYEARVVDGDDIERLVEQSGAEVARACFSATSYAPEAVRAAERAEVALFVLELGGQMHPVTVPAYAIAAGEHPALRAEPAPPRGRRARTGAPSRGSLALAALAVTAAAVLGPLRWLRDGEMVLVSALALLACALLVAALAVAAVRRTDSSRDHAPGRGRRSTTRP